MKTGTMPLKPISQSSGRVLRKRNKKPLAEYLSKTAIILYVLSFLIGRGQLVKGLLPFGLAFYVSGCGLVTARFPVALCMILGMITGSNAEQVYITLSGMLLFHAFNLPFRDKKENPNFRHAATAFLSILLPGMLMTYFQGFLVYDMLKTLLSAFFTFLLVFVFKNALAVLADPGRRYAYTNEEVISLAITTTLALAGLGEFKILGFCIKNIISILVVLVYSYKCGAGAGAAIGVAVGLIISITSAATPLLVGSYAFCGLLSGVFKNLGKVGSGLGFIMGNAVITLYMTDSTEVLIHLKEIFLATAGFLIIPGKFSDRLASMMKAPLEMALDRKGYSERIKEITVEKLKRFSQAFRELSKTFGEISQTRPAANKNDIAALLDRVADKVCKGCSLCAHCWDRNFCGTYQVMFKVIEKLDAKGRVDERDIPEYFLERCERINDFVREINTVYELFRMDMLWKNKIGESRELVSHQLEGLSRVISGLASEIDTEIHFKKDLEENILRYLNVSGISPLEAVVHENRRGKYEIEIIHKGCGGRRNCATIIQKLVSDAVGRKMMRAKNDCNMKMSDGKCTLRLVEEETYSIATGIARTVKYGSMTTGDSYTFMNTGEGMFVIALSDGMGSGQRASVQSRATISLLEQLIESGFDKDTAVKLVNSILVLKSSEDEFSTIDLSIIDLYSGETEFIKAGADATYIKREDRVETVKSTSLPAGILGGMETELAHKKLTDGNFIIMMSDGVRDAFKNCGEQNEREVLAFIQQASTLNPQQMADSIMEEALGRCANKAGDDMTVLVAKVWKRV